MKSCPIPEPEMTKAEGIVFLKSIEALLKITGKPEYPELKFFTDDPELYNKYNKAIIAVGCTVITRAPDGVSADGEENLIMLANMGINYQGSSNFRTVER